MLYYYYYHYYSTRPQRTLGAGVLPFAESALRRNPLLVSCIACVQDIKGSPSLSVGVMCCLCPRYSIKCLLPASVHQCTGACTKALFRRRRNLAAFPRSLKMRLPSSGQVEWLFYGCLQGRSALSSGKPGIGSHWRCTVRGHSIACT